MVGAAGTADVEVEGRFGVEDGGVVDAGVAEEAGGGTDAVVAAGTGVDETGVVVAGGGRLG